ncbi:hypothetical protein [uncultured Mediterranean phage uvDeep-CGR0-AD1-C123]|nr:hypothetical protein [uncultured Mediterranean phage uvDeep-CGR0-AD1-C123]
MTYEEAGEHRKALKLEIEILESRFLPHGTGNLHDAVAVLNRRVTEIDEAFMLKGFAEG